jgi:hypothetical protein
LHRFVYNPATNKVYKAGAVPISDAEAATITVDNIGYPWERMWTNKKAKMAVLDMCYDELVRIIEKGARTCETTQYIVHGLHDRIATHPVVYGHHKEMPELHYGEGDLKAIYWAMHHARHGDRVLLVTVDWDQAISTMAYDSGVDLLIWRVFVNKYDKESEPFYMDLDRCQMTRATAESKLAKPVYSAFEILGESK